jgi:hypothetical protein
MRNLAGDPDCDRFIRDELQRALIPIKELDTPQKGEVPAKLQGELGPYTFERAWYYWIVRGDVPLAVAQELYQHPVGKADVRVVGHCGCPPPEEWSTETSSGPVITHYHIDTQEGLILFVNTIRKYNLHDSSLDKGTPYGN